MQWRVLLRSHAEEQLFLLWLTCDRHQCHRFTSQTLQHQKKQWRYFSTSCVLVVSGDWWGCQINNLLFQVNIMEKDIRMNKTSTFCIIFCTRRGQIDYSLIDRLSTYFSWSSYAFQVQSLLLTINCHQSKVRMLITMFYGAVTHAPLLFVK